MLGLGLVLFGLGIAFGLALESECGAQAEVWDGARAGVEAGVVAGGGTGAGIRDGVEA